MERYDPLSENLVGVAGDVPLFRIVRLDRLLDDIRAGVLTMPRVMQWEDSHEAAYFRTKLRAASGESVSIEDLGLQWFGQCWSKTAESDAMWRIYNAKHDSVRIETTAGDLLRVLHDSRVSLEPAFQDWSRLALFVGNVEYHDAVSYQKVMAQPFRDLTLGANPRGLAMMLLQKRAPFSHEQEVRILYQMLQGGSYPLDDSKHFAPHAEYTFKFRTFQKTVPPLIRLPFDWKVVKGAMVGPRAPDANWLSARTQLDGLAPWMSISRSELYGPPDLTGTL